ncbi:hypothetical protein [Cellulomonas soli]
MTRPDKHRPESLAFGTQAVHAGNAIDAGSGAIRTPIVMANSYALPPDPASIKLVGRRHPFVHAQLRGQPEGPAGQARRARGW